MRTLSSYGRLIAVVLCTTFFAAPLVGVAQVGGGVYTPEPTLATIVGVLSPSKGGTGVVNPTTSALYKGAGSSAMVASSITDNGTTFAVATNKLTVDLATGNAAVSGVMQSALHVSGNEVRANGDLGGAVGSNSLTNGASSTIGAGLGSVKMSTAVGADNIGWVKLRMGTTVVWVPVWATNAP